MSVRTQVFYLLTNLFKKLSRSTLKIHQNFTLFSSKFHFALLVCKQRGYSIHNTWCILYETFISNQLINWALSAKQCKMQRQLHFTLLLNMDFHLNSLLNLPNTTVFTCYKEAGFIFLHLQLTNEGINCPNCQSYTDIVHQTSHILIRDLSIIGAGVYLKVPRRKFY